MARSRAQAGLAGPVGLVLALTLLVWVGPPGSTALSTAAADPPTVPVVPSALPLGAPVRPPARLLDGALVRSGRPPVPLAAPGRVPDTLHRARGGYLVDSRIVDNGRTAAHRIEFVGDDGTRRVVRARTSYAVQRVATDGRSFVGSRARPKTRTGRSQQGVVLRRIRVADGRAVGRTLEIAGRPSLLEVARRRVLVGYLPLVGPHRDRPRTLWWSTGTGRTRLVATAPARRSPVLTDHQAGSFEARAFSVVAGRRQVVRDIRTDRWLWRTASGQAVLAFSPDGRAAITLAVPEYYGGEDSGEGYVEKEDYLVRVLTLRNARTGRVLVRFTGHFEGFVLRGPDRAPTHWESPDAFVIHAYSGLATVDAELRPQGETPIRCRVSAARCERVPDDGGLDGTWVTPHS